MKKELQEELFQKYPKIFRQKDLPMSQTAMCWGIDCGDGWFWLIDSLCFEIQSHVNSIVDSAKTRRKHNSWKNIIHDYRWGWKTLRWYAGLFSRFKIYLDYRKTFDSSTLQVEAVQVKEKYGTLRFYTSNCDDVVFGITNFAEYLSSKICEECGTLINVTQNEDGWVRTLCDGCCSKREES